MKRSKANMALASKRWRKWLGWGLFSVALVVLGFALDAWLPPQPRFVLRGPDLRFGPTLLSSDGKLLTRPVILSDDADDGACISLQTWDTFSGQQRDEVFRRLTEPATAGVPPAQAPDAETPWRGFKPEDVAYSSDRRACALLHPGGLALASLSTGQEWPKVVGWQGDQPGPRELSPLYRRLQQPVDTSGLQEKVKLKDALKYLANRSGAELPFRLDRAAFVDDPLEEEVFLPAVPATMGMHTALRIMLGQVGKGSAFCLFRRNHLEITSSQRYCEDKFGPPVFSPRGTFLAIMEGWPRENKLHVVDCASGQLVASLSVHMNAYEVFGFTSDDELLYYFAADKETPVFTVWSTRERQVVRTSKEIHLADADELPYLFAPDGKTILVNSRKFKEGGSGLYDLRTGTMRYLVDGVKRAGQNSEETPHPEFRFSPDGRTLSWVGVGEVQFWNVLTCKKRATVKLDRTLEGWHDLTVSANSRVLAIQDQSREMAEKHRYTVLDLETGNQLWHRHGSLSDSKFPEFPPAGPFLVERKKHRIDILDSQTGEPHASLFLGEDARPSTWQLTFTPDGSKMATTWDYDDNRKPWFIEAWLGKWWPFRTPTGCFLVADLASGQVPLRVELRRHVLADHELSDDGRTLMTITSDENDNRTLCCWDVPARTSRTWVIGIPLALAIVGGLISWRFTRRKQQPQAVQGNSAREARGGRPNGAECHLSVSDTARGGDCPI